MLPSTPPRTSPGARCGGLKLLRSPPAASTPSAIASPVTSITIGSPATSGTRMRRDRSLTKPAVPRRSISMRPKKPAMRKNSGMRNMWIVYQTPASVSLGVSVTIQGKPAMYGCAACSAMPSSSAKALTASSPCNLICGVHSDLSLLNAESRGLSRRTAAT